MSLYKLVFIITYLTWTIAVNFPAQTCVRLIRIICDSDHHQTTLKTDGELSRSIQITTLKAHHCRSYSSQSKEPPGSNTAGGDSKKTTPPGTSKGTSIGGSKSGRGGDKKGGSGEWLCPKCGDPCTHVDAYVCKSFVQTSVYSLTLL